MATTPKTVSYLPPGAGEVTHDADHRFGSRWMIATSLGSPWQNAYAERFIGTLRRECLDHVIVLNERHLLRVVGDFLIYYHDARPHQSLGRDSPHGRAAETGTGVVMAESMVNGLHHRYRRAA